jgi:hypothetical protein
MRGLRLLPATSAAVAAARVAASHPSLAPVRVTRRDDQALARRRPPTHDHLRRRQPGHLPQRGLQTTDLCHATDLLATPLLRLSSGPRWRLPPTAARSTLGPASSSLRPPEPSVTDGQRRTQVSLGLIRAHCRCSTKSCRAARAHAAGGRMQGPAEIVCTGVSTVRRGP